LEADVVIIGSGAAGLPAAIKAADGGASVIVVETNYDIGGHGIISGGNVPLGGGTSAQKKYGIKDSPDTSSRISPTGPLCKITAGRISATTTGR
jgi:succinate dehydrogenase/fumarate reductase flavoprotein subunit